MGKYAVSGNSRIIYNGKYTTYGSVPETLTPLYNWYTISDGAYSDWFLPSRQELNAMYDNLKVYNVGNFLSNYYISSSEQTSSSIYVKRFSDGFEAGASKGDTTNLIRPCRTFISYNDYNLRDVGQSGGYIFHKINNGNGTYTYYEALNYDLGTKIWSNLTVTLLGNTLQTIGSGLQNSINITNQGGFYIGAAYTALNHSKSRLNIANFRPPLINDINILISSLGGATVAGGKLKEIGNDNWLNNIGASNFYNFSGKGEGYRNNNGIFNNKKIYAGYFISEQNFTEQQYANAMFIYNYNTQCDNASLFSLRLGLCIRLMTDILPSSDTFTDYDGNIYTWTQIGTQYWLKQDLKTTHYNDGTPIPNVTDNTTWANLTTGALCYYP